MLDEVYQEIELPYIAVDQPLGTFYLASVPHRTLFDIASADVRRMVKERDIESYLGIQRPLNPKRVKEIKAYATTVDACFPTNVVLSVKSRSAEIRGDKLILKNDPSPSDSNLKPIYVKQIANVLDGQHRIAGLEDYSGSAFDVPVCIFVDIDISDEAYIFATVNLAQTKVNKSLVYDLFELAKTRSPQKTAHNIAVALDRTPNSPFLERIKRLGSATPGRDSETITQATFVEALLAHISVAPNIDRDLYLRGRSPASPSAEEQKQLIFRKFFLEGQDNETTDVVWNYFEAVQRRWPKAWTSTSGGQMLNRTNGVKALLRFLRPCYLRVTGLGTVPESSEFDAVFNKVKLSDSDFDINRFKPGSSGESFLLQMLIAEGLDGRG